MVTMKQSIILIILCLLLIYGSLFAMGNVHANPIGAVPPTDIYIRSDGSIDPPTVPIQQNGNIYTLTGNLQNYSITIQCNNIILDGAGYMLQGIYPMVFDGISLDFSPHDLVGNNVTRQNIKSTYNVTIENLKITQYSQAISAPFASNITITRNTIQTMNGLDFGPDDSNNQIINNIITGVSPTSGEGIWIEGSENTITGNNISNFYSSIEVFQGTDNLISNNILDKNITINKLANDTVLINNIISLSSPTPISIGSTATPSPTTISPITTPTPTVPEISFFIILPLLLSMFSVIAIIKLRHRKIINLGQ